MSSPVRVFTTSLLIVISSATALRGVPTITQQPKDSTAIAGTAVSLSVVASSTGPLTYQWRHDGWVLANATDSFLPIPVASQTDSGAYDVQISDGTGTVTSAPVTLRVAPAIYPGHVTPDVASTVRFETTNGIVRKVVSLPDGRFYIAGSFTSVQGQPCAYVARFAANGSWDPTFIPAKFDDFVYSIAVQSDGRLIVAGDFTTVDTVPCPGIARLNNDGSRDTSFVGLASKTMVSPKCSIAVVAADGSIFVGGSFMFSPTQVAVLLKLTTTGELDSSFRADSLVQAPTSMALAPDGKIYLAGTTITLNGAYNYAGVFRLLANGNIDLTFNAGTGGVTNGMTVCRQSDGHVIVAGYFTNFNNSGLAGLVRLDDTGAVDRTFRYTLPTNYVVNSVREDVDGRLWLAGSLPTGPIIRLMADGSIDSTFAGPSSRFDSVADLAVLPGRRVVVVSGFVNTDSTGVIASKGAAIFESDGQMNSFDAGFRYPAAVNLLKLVQGGKILVGGNFKYCKGVSSPPIIRLNGDLTIDSTFDASASGLRSISSGLVQPDGRIFLVGSTAYASAATMRLTKNGALDTSFAIYVLTGIIGSPTILHDGRILLVDSSASADGFDVFASNGTKITDHGIASAGAGNGVYVTSAAQLPSGQILFGGSFSSWAGQNKPKLARVNQDGQLDGSFTVSPVSISTATSFDSENRVLQSGGRVLVATYGSSPSSTPTLSRFLSTGVADPSFSLGTLTLLSLHGYTIEADDRVLMWGQLSTDFGAPIVARRLADGGIDSTFAIVGDATSVNRTTLAWSQCLTLDSGDIVAASSDGTLARYKNVTTPVITAQPASVVVPAGDPFTLSVTADGPGVLAYQWYLNGAPVSGATSSTLTIPISLPLHSGSYRVVITNFNGITSSQIATVTVDASSTQNARLSNLSVRAMVASTPLIAGFATSGRGRDILIRGVGPGLVQLGVADASSDPKISLYDGQTLTDENDNWGGDPTLSAIATRLGAFPLSPNGLDAVLLRTVVGTRTVHVQSMSGSGVCLIELYDASTTNAATDRLINASARYFVGTGGNILIAGITIAGPGQKGILVRGVGPGLGILGVQGFLADPKIAMYSGVTKIAENDDWGGTFTLSSASAAVGAFPLAASSHDAALITYLPAGSYTVQLSGVGDTTGEGMIEVYELP